MLTGERRLGKAETGQKPTKFVGILDCYHFALARAVVNFQAKQPKAQGGCPTHGRPGIVLG
ncbi:MAG: hypothetical protein KUL81_13150, partial [Azonexus sp.]|nr:hypothetical protein [Azonexus sp.]